MDGEEEEEEDNGQRYAKMEVKTDGDTLHVRKTQTPINHHTYWIQKISEMMCVFPCVCVCGQV